MLAAVQPSGAVAQGGLAGLWIGQLVRVDVEQGSRLGHLQLGYGHLYVT